MTCLLGKMQKVTPKILQALNASQTERAEGTALALLAIFIVQSRRNWERTEAIICIFIGLQVPLG